MEPLLESGAVRLQTIDLGCDEVEPEPKSGAATQVRAWWTVTVRIGDAGAARELAACPVTDAEARAEIERSFSAVWHWTAPPYAPMAEIAGVTWAPISVTVEQILARRSRSEQ
ncbi:MAG: hypothetical protein ACRDKL_02095 [Solirubrobacteraceae bacterium]